MKRIDASKEGIFDISWSPDNQWLTYVAAGSGVRMANIENQEIRDIGAGAWPGITSAMSVVMERDDEIVLVSGKGTKTLVSTKDIVKDSPKRAPVVAPTGDLAAAVMCNVYDKDSEEKNAYNYRHFVILVPFDSGRPLATSAQWYGGTIAWFPDGQALAHFEFDSTAGPQTHLVDRKGESLGVLAGLYPSISPDGRQLAVRPRAGGSVVVYSTKKGWSDQDVETNVLKIPANVAGARLSANPPIWIDTRFLIVEEAGALWRLDSRRDKAEQLKKLPLPTQRRRHTMIPSPNREWLACEVESEEGFELRIYPLG